jgi:uridine kinase
MDNFLMDREFREGKSIDKRTIHFNLFQKNLTEILQGKAITIPCYDSIDKVSSHDPEGNLRPGGRMITIEPGDVIFLEGNFPFQIPEIRSMIHLMVIYLTDDPIRLKRKWKRDVDYRKSYDPSHFRNRFFVTQFLRAEDCFRGLIEQSDIVVDTTGAAIWLTPEIAQLVDGKKA